MEYQIIFQDSDANIPHNSFNIQLQKATYSLVIMNVLNHPVLNRYMKQSI